MRVRLPLTRGYLIPLVACLSLAGASCDRGAPEGHRHDVDASVVELREAVRVDGSTADLVPADASRGLAVLPNRNVVLTQSIDGLVKIFGHNGEARGAVGGKGRGPGEFAAVSRVNAIGDSIWVWDARLLRGTIFAGSKFARTFDIKTESRVGGRVHFVAISPVALYSGGSYIGYGDTGNGTALVLGHFDRDSLRVIATVNEALESRNVRLGDGSLVYADLFPNTPLFGVSADGAHVVIVRPKTDGERAGLFNLTVMNAIGDTIAVRELKFDGEEIPASAADSVLAARVAGLSAAQGSVLKRKAHVPRLYPPFVSLVVAADHSVWLQQRPGVDRQDYTVVLPDGNNTRIVRLPAGSVIGVVQNDCVWALQANNDGVQSLVRFDFAQSWHER
jgi:hypothetical protein